MHTITEEIIEALEDDGKLKEAWGKLTDLARNEWICYTTMAKKEETRAKRLDRMCEDLLKGKKRPCCWPGCPHRRPSARKWFK